LPYFRLLDSLLAQSITLHSLHVLTHRAILCIPPAKRAYLNVTPHLLWGLGGCRNKCGMTHKKAFSLVELSIVLVILGLLTGGILTVQSLIRASELRAASTEYTRYVTATQTFRDKYFAIPGDMTNATRFWGRLNGNADCVTNSSAAVATPGTCDGNGDGTYSTSGSANVSTEIFQVWRHLALAGLIEGTYSGLTEATAAPIPNVNVPGSKLSSTGTYAIWCCADVFGGNSIWFAGSYYHAFMLGGATAGNWPLTPILKPEEAWNIDTKIDDGRPGIGKVVAGNWSTGCTQGATVPSDTAIATYNLSNNSNQCILTFPNAF
jgi:prepilin-type N-terminal cleavage/methylation domain-containing protein